MKNAAEKLSSAIRRERIVQAAGRMETGHCVEAIQSILDVIADRARAAARRCGGEGGAALEDFAEELER